MSGKKTMMAPGELQFYQELGRYIMAQRMRLGLSQKDVAQTLGITFQQVQKYEIADNRVPTFVLHKLARIYGISFAGIVGADIGKDNYRVLNRDAVKGAIRNISDNLKRLEQTLQIK